MTDAAPNGTTPHAGQDIAAAGTQLAEDLNKDAPGAIIEAEQDVEAEVSLFEKVKADLIGLVDWTEDEFDKLKAAIEKHA